MITSQLPLHLNNSNFLGLPIFQFARLNREAGVRHAISSRFGPTQPLVPQAQPELVNDYRLSGPGGTIALDIIRQRRRELLAAMLGYDAPDLLQNLTSPWQKHTANVAVAGPEVLGAERNWTNSIPNMDAVITNLPNVPLLTAHADCPPIVLYDPVSKAIGAVHSGWRGTVGQIARATVQAMQQNYGSRPENILAGVGPSIGPCCYQVGEPVLSMVREAFGPEHAAQLLIEQPNGNPHFDLWQAIHLTLLQSGIQPANIEHSELCSQCNSDSFFSYRATPLEQRHNYGNYVLMVMLVD